MWSSPVGLGAKRTRTVSAMEVRKGEGSGRPSIAAASETVAQIRVKASPRAVMSGVAYCPTSVSSSTVTPGHIT